MGGTMMERRDADGGAGGAAGTGGHPGQAWARVRAWFKNPTIMRAFFGYALVWLVVASTVVLVAIGALMEVYYRVSDEHRAEHVEVNAGPYIYDAATDELLRATPVYLEDSYDHIVFVAFVHAARDEAEDSIVAGRWNRDMRVVDATMGLLRSDPSYRVSDWGGNYTEEQYRATGGEPYDPDATISTDDLAAYDARERAARLQTVDAFGAGDFGEDVLLSNVAYYVRSTRRATLRGSIGRCGSRPASGCPSWRTAAWRCCSSAGSTGAILAGRSRSWAGRRSASQRATSISRSIRCAGAS